ncbi:hypothetical protein [Actinomycetospora aeridis]|uniref:Transmembrane protein PGPGW n=1 Tax=Actinomycetospora aeridis TaxID=3129231 RepID=A0ABU8NA68_9PSEU
MRTTVTWRYALLGVGFLVLAGVRAAQGAPVWAAVFALAAAANVWLALRDDRGPRAPATPVAATADEVARELARCRTAQRQWRVLGVAGLLLAGGLLLVEPPLAVIAAAATLVAVFRARRVRTYAEGLPVRLGDEVTHA